MKLFSISAFFPEVRPAHAAFQSATAEASEMSIAAARGIDEIRQRPGLKGRHITEVKIMIKELPSRGKCGTEPAQS
jgi:hypothetical protein